MYYYIAKGGGGGGRSSGGARSSASKSSSGTSKSTPSKSNTNTTKSTTPSKPSGKSTAKPGSTIKTADGKTVKTSSTKPANSKYSRSTGVVGDNGYSPRFQGGYTAPPGSVVYYPQHSALDYLPWIYIFSQNNSPHYDQATVVQPDNKQVVAEPQKGVDGMIIFNWIVLILIVMAIIGGVVWLVNKKTQPKDAYAAV